MHSRHGENPKLRFRSERYYRCNDGWYFFTREGIAVGPFRNRFEAEVDSGLLIALLKNTPPEAALRVIRDFLMASGGAIDLVNDPAFTSYVTGEGSETLSQRQA
jgi:hypothetical protein